VNDVPTPDRGEEDAGAQIDRVGNAEVQIEPFDGRRLPMVLDPTSEKKRSRATGSQITKRLRSSRLKRAA